MKTFKIRAAIVVCFPLALLVILALELLDALAEVVEAVQDLWSEAKKDWKSAGE